MNMLRNFVSGMLVISIIFYFSIAQGAEPKFNSTTPEKNTQSYFGENKEFGATTNQTVNFTWYINLTQQGSPETETTTSSYSNSSASVGEYIVTLSATNLNGPISYDWIWTVKVPPEPSITSRVPDKDTVDTNNGSSQTFKIDFNQTVNVIWYLNDSPMQYEPNKATSSLFYNSSPEGKYNVTVEIKNGNGQDSRKWTWNVNPKTYYSGNRIWDEDAGMSDTYTWTAKSFSGFYYDLDTDEGSETLTIYNIDRSLKGGEIKYETKPIPVEFENSRWDTYEVIGFMAYRYFAGYTDDTTFASSSDSLLDEEKLSKVLTDNDKKIRLNSGSVLELEEGYEFKITEFSSDGENIMVGIFKDGEKVDETVVNERDTFVYEKDLGGAKDMPIIAIYIDTVFIGQETSSVNIEGIFQISNEYIDVSAGDEFGLMEIKSVSSSGITMENNKSVSLGVGDDFNLMGKINIVVADSNTLRFAPYVDISKPGTYELRGTLTEENEFKWTPFNFEGLLYDIDTGEGGESLEIKRDSSGDRSIGKNNLSYTTSPISKSFEHNSDGWNTFQSIGFMGDAYLAVYLKESSFISSDRSLINESKLSKILIDEDKNHTIHIGNSLMLEEGYSLRIDEISRSGDTLMIALLKNGEEITTDIAGEGDTYIYEVDVNGTDIPIIVAHIDKISGSNETNSSLIDGLFQISDNFTTVKNGDTYGIMEVTSFSSSIVLKNEDSFNLSKGDTINIMGDIKFKVADDSSAIRFYPFREIIEVLAIITQPEDGAYINGTINIIGTANDTNFKNYTLERKNTSSAWIEIRNSTQPVSEGTVAIWNITDLEDDDYMIRLTVADNASNSNMILVNVTIDNTPPVVKITEPKHNSTRRFFDNMVRGEVNEDNLDSARLKVKNISGEIVNSYNLNITDGEFSKRVEFAPNQSNILEFVAVDKAKNSNSTNITVSVGNSTLINQTDVAKGVPVIIDAQNETNTAIKFISNVNRSDVTFTVTAITNEKRINNLTNSVFTAYGEMAVGKIVEINVTGLNASNESVVQSVTLNLYYTISDLDLDGDGTIETGELDEDNLYIYWYNDTSQNWTKLTKEDNPGKVIDNGQLKISGDDPGYVWAKVNHLSMFALAALPVAEPTEGGNNENNNGNGGRGSSRGGSSGEDYYNIVLSETDRQSVFNGSDISFRFDLEGNIAQCINFTALNSAGTVAAKVEILNHTSTLVTVPPPDEVFKNLNIWVGNYGWATEKNMAGTTVSFIVTKSWVIDNDIDETTIALHRYSDNNWNKLVTRKIAEDANSLQFEAETPGFSPFAVTGKTMGETGDEGIIAEPAITPEKTPVSAPTEKTGIPGFGLFVCLSVLLIAMRLLHKKN